MRSWGVLIPLAAILAWPLIAIVSMVMKTRVRELEIRERIAMIEKGLVPPPERDPAGFDRAMSAYDRRSLRRSEVGRHRRTGVMLIGIGFGLMLLIGVAGQNDLQSAIGVGGFVVLLGLTFLVIGLIEGPGQVPPAPGSSSPGSTNPTAGSPD